MNAQGILDNISNVKHQDKDSYLLDKSKGTITSTLIGGGVGFLIAYNRNGNLLIGTILGAAITGFAANFFINKR